jgi:PqqD family protein of HPr-rel-A system
MRLSPVAVTLPHVDSLDPDAGSSLRRELPLLNGEAANAAPPLGVPLDYRPRKSSDVLELDMGDGLILYNHDADLVHHLNPSAAIVWQICDGEATVKQLAGEIAEQYGLGPDEIRDQLARLIGELEALGLVEDSKHPSA